MISFEVAPGETFGFLGPNGAGKSTTISMLCTLAKPSGGRAFVDGFDVVAAQTEVRRRIGLVFQDATLDDYLTAEEAVGLDPQTRASIWDYINLLKARELITMFLTTHYMDEAENCDRIAIIDGGEIVKIDTPAALKASVGSDRVEIHTDDDIAALAALESSFGLAPTMSEGSVTVHVPAGEEFVPRLFAELGVRIRSVRVSRPTFDDVFMRYTGRTIRDAESSSSERLKSSPMLRGRRM